MTLPAHRFLERRKKDAGDRVVVVDFDETVTKAPEHVGFVLGALRAAGCKVIILTGNASPHNDLVQRLDDYGVPFDDLIQYHDEDSSGIVREKYLEQLGAWLGIDNRIDRAPTYVKACPHLFVVSKPTDEAKDDAKGGKKQAKKAAKDIRTEQRSVPPNYRLATVAGENCKTCRFDNNGHCVKYNVDVDPQHVCDKWSSRHR